MCLTCSLFSAFVIVNELVLFEFTLLVVKINVEV